MPDKRQGQLVKPATEEADSQPVRLTQGSLSAILQRGTEHQRRRLYTQAQLRAQLRQLYPSARSYEELPPNLMLQGAYRF
jgi:hypothetical protein